MKENPITKARKKQLDNLFSELQDLIWVGEAVRFEAYEELMDEEGRLDLQYIKDEFITSQVNAKIFHKQAEQVLGTSKFGEEEQTEPMPVVTREEFLEQYEPAYYLNQRRWVRHWLMQGRCLRRHELFEWILETAKPKKLSSGAPMLRAI